jgi:hypothetical protein
MAASAPIPTPTQPKLRAVWFEDAEGDDVDSCVEADAAS